MTLCSVSGSRASQVPEGHTRRVTVVMNSPCKCEQRAEPVQTPWSTALSDADDADAVRCTGPAAKYLEHFKSSVSQ